MPISRREFESGALDPSLLIIDFLRSNAGYAYTLDELKLEVASRGVNSTDEDMRNVLKSLESGGRIEAKTKSGVIYYIYRKPSMGFRAPGR